MTASQIINSVALRWRLPVAAILGPSHAPRPSTARHIAIREVRAKKPELSMRAIGKIFHRSARVVHYAVHAAVRGNRLRPTPEEVEVAAE